MKRLQLKQLLGKVFKLKQILSKGFQLKRFQIKLFQLKSVRLNSFQLKRLFKLNIKPFQHQQETNPLRRRFPKAKIAVFGLDFLKNLKIGGKIYLLILLSTLFLIAVGFNGFTSMKKMNDNSNTLFQSDLIPVQWLMQAESNQRLADSTVMEMILANDEYKNKDLSSQIQKLNQKTDQLINQYEKTDLSPQERDTLKQYRKFLQNYRSEQQKVIDLAVALRSKEAFDYYTLNLPGLRDRVSSLQQELISDHSSRAETLNHSNQLSFGRTVASMLILTVVAALVCVLIGFLVVRMITSPLKHISYLMAEAAKGDLTVEGHYQSRDEIGTLTESFNRMMNGLQQMVVRIQKNSLHLLDSANNLSTSIEQNTQEAKQVSAITEEVASGSDQQVHFMQESATAIAEVSKGIQQIAEHAHQVSLNAIESSEHVEEGNAALESAIHQMQIIEKTVRQLSATVNRLTDRSKQIDQFVGVIRGLTEQTHLLALNAAIEAARAGEHGKGFAVVAGEVRKLSDQSKQSAEMISKIVADIHGDVTAAADSMNLGLQEVVKGMEAIDLADQSFGKIGRSTDIVAAQIQEVSVASGQISANAVQVVSSFDRITEIADRSAAGSQSIAAAVERQLALMQDMMHSAAVLTDMAKEMQLDVEKFRLTAQGSGFTNS